MLVNLACDWGRPARNWPCAWTPSAYYRFLLSVSRNRFLSTDLQSAFLEALRKRAVLRLPDGPHKPTRFAPRPKGGLSHRIDFASTRIQATSYSSAAPYGRIGESNSLVGHSWLSTSGLLTPRWTAKSGCPTLP